jgi:hypothetical protein
VTVNFTPVGLNGVADQITHIALAHVKYLAGGQTTSIGDLGGDTPFTTSQLAYATSSNTMQVAGVAPVVSLIAPAGTLTTGTVKIGSVTIVAPTGNMTLNNLPLVITGSGATTTTGVANSIIVKDASNGSTISTASTAVSATDGSTTVSFTGGYTIAAGSAGKTFDIYAPVIFSPTSTQSGSARINLGLGAPTGFNWFDVNGNVALNGVYILNYPNTTVSSSN